MNVVREQMFDFLNKDDTAWKYLRGRDLFLEIDFTLGYIIQVLEIDTCTSDDGIEILGRWKPFFLRSTSLRATLHELWRPLPGKVVAAKLKMACALSTISNMQCGLPETCKFDTSELMEIYQKKNYYFDLKFTSTAI